MSEQEKTGKSEPKKSNDLLRYSGLGMQFFLTIAICGSLGYKMDEWWRESRPLFVVIMIFLGTVGGFYQLYRATKPK